jgi:hypothetical protein
MVAIANSPNYNKTVIMTGFTKVLADDKNFVLNKTKSPHNHSIHLDSNFQYIDVFMNSFRSDRTRNIEKIRFGSIFEENSRVSPK